MQPLNLLVSVVIPTYQRPELLNACLEALSKQTLSPECYEVIVVDDEPSPVTAEVVTSFSRARVGAIVGGTIQTMTDDGERVRYIPLLHHHGPAAARNAGWRAARGEVVAFTDDDCLPARTWLESGLAAMDEGLDGVSGQVWVPLPPDPSDFDLNLAGLERSKFVTANCFYRRGALLEVDGFDERFVVPWREDSDLFFSLIEAGKQLDEAPGAIVLHPPRPAPWGVSLKEQRKSMFNALLYKKHARLYRSTLQAFPPLHYYLTLLALVAGVVAALAGHLQLASAAALIWLGLTCLFCYRRLQGTSRRPRHLLEMAVTSVLIPPLSVFWRLRGAFKYRVLFI